MSLILSHSCCLESGPNDFNAATMCCVFMRPLNSRLFCHAILYVITMIRNPFKLTLRGKIQKYQDKEQGWTYLDCKVVVLWVLSWVITIRSLFEIEITKLGVFCFWISLFDRSSRNFSEISSTSATQMAAEPLLEDTGVLSEVYLGATLEPLEDQHGEKESVHNDPHYISRYCISLPQASESMGNDDPKELNPSRTNLDKEGDLDVPRKGPKRRRVGGMRLSSIHFHFLSSSYYAPHFYGARPGGNHRAFLGDIHSSGWLAGWPVRAFVHAWVSE